jgi:subtilisin family serine protease
VFAAGNNGCDTDGDGMLAHEEAIVVAALEGNDQRAGYSNFGDVVDISAPTGLLTTDVFPGGYGSYGGLDEFSDGFSGTSGATPVVSGVVALMIEANPRLTAAEIREVLCETSVRVDLENAAYDEQGRSPYYGCGRVDAGAAVAAVANGEPGAPVPVRVSELVYAPRAVLAWDPAADPDGDVLFYELEWARDGGDPVVVEVNGTSLDVGPEIDAGDVVTWQVRAVDPWGPGPWSELVETQMILPPDPPADVEEPARGCATSGGAGWVGLIALIGLRTSSRRRRGA